MVKQLEQISSKFEDHEIKHSNEMNEMRESIDKAKSSNESTANYQSSVQDPWFQAALAKGKGKGKVRDDTPVDTNARNTATSDEWSGLWILGNLGFDTATDLLIERAKEILGKLPGFSISDLVEDISTFGSRPGSLVIIKFKVQEEGDKWRPKIFLLNHRFPEHSAEFRASRNQTGTGTVYLQKQKTEAKRRPMVITKRCVSELSRIEEALPEDQRKPIKVSRFLVSVSGKTVGFSFHGRWQWTDDGLSYLNERGIHRDAITSAIEGTW